MFIAYSIILIIKKIFRLALKLGVDLADQYIAHCRIKIKSMRWYKKGFYYILDMCLANSYRLYKADNSEDTITYYEFKGAVCRSLMKVETADPERRAQILAQRPQAMLSLCLIISEQMDITTGLK